MKKYKTLKFVSLINSIIDCVYAVISLGIGLFLVVGIGILSDFLELPLVDYDGPGGGYIFIGDGVLKMLAALSWLVMVILAIVFVLMVVNFLVPAISGFIARGKNKHEVNIRPYHVDSVLKIVFNGLPFSVLGFATIISGEIDLFGFIEILGTGALFGLSIYQLVLVLDTKKELVA